MKEYSAYVRCGEKQDDNYAVEMLERRTAGGDGGKSHITRPLCRLPGRLVDPPLTNRERTDPSSRRTRVPVRHACGKDGSTQVAGCPRQRQYSTRGNRIKGKNEDSQGPDIHGEKGKEYKEMIKVMTGPRAAG